MSSKETRKVRPQRFEKGEPALPGIYCNAFQISCQKSEVFINFGLLAPSYFERGSGKLFPVARVVLPWPTAEALSKMLPNAITKYKNKDETKKVGDRKEA